VTLISTDKLNNKINMVEPIRLMKENNSGLAEGRKPYLQTDSNQFKHNTSKISKSVEV